MDREELSELQCITPIANLASIAFLGILCHKLAAELDHTDVSSGIIQDRRAGREVPDVRRSPPLELHEYANVYICARNPMMYVLRDLHEELAVLRVSCEVLDVEGAVIADGNASSDYTGFHASPAGLSMIDATITFLGDPRHPNPPEFYDRKRRQCAEVLVPEVIAPEFLLGVYVSCAASRASVEELELPWPVTVDPRMFFQQ